MKEFTLKQVATNVPPENVQDVRIDLWEKSNTLFVSTAEGWMIINLQDQTFAVGDYEG